MERIENSRRQYCPESSPQCKGDSPTDHSVSHCHGDRKSDDF